MDSLCDQCRKIPFRELQEDPKWKMKQTELGAYGDVKQRASCSFCSLVFESIQDIASRAGFSADEWAKKAGGWADNVWVDWDTRNCCFNVSLSTIDLRYTTGACSRLGRVVSPMPIDTEVITSLLAECDTSHQCLLSVSNDDVSRLPTLRAIDVRQMCITYIGPSARYVALSYVWGGVPVPYLLRANKKELMRPFALQACYNTIPLTIQNAIELVHKMNIEYLWVDALCLVQDDREDMDIGINAMSIIYEHAYFSIIAADGLNADSGLPGIRPRKVNQVTAEVIPGVTLTGSYDAYSYLIEEHYSSRAWTFQEYQLSRRKLIFLGSMVHYQCMEGSWSEDREELQISSEIRFGVPSPTKANQNFLSFAGILQRYCTRQATYQHDIVNAVISVYHKIVGRTHGGHIFGIPAVAFDWFMCFYTWDTGVDYLERRESLPSWAWSGWKGRVQWNGRPDDSELLVWSAKSTWIIWYIRDSAQQLCLIWDIAQSDGNSFMAQTERIFSERVTNMRRFSANALSTQPLRNIPHTVERPYNLLQFWTFSNYFSLRIDKKGEEYLDSLEFDKWKVHLEVFDRDDKYCGFIYVDEESSRYDHAAIELVVISESFAAIPLDYSFIYSSTNVRNMKPLENECCYNVLYVVEKSGVAERKGFGKVYSEAIKISPESPWEWKEFILG
ncbi:HET-domain-containing protein [Xylariaceae sp. AK1471]|nr:HET-domain-containing protein [Xylariaceae sp. AK1471]